jgi:hypothetical protein
MCTVSGLNLKKIDIVCVVTEVGTWGEYRMYLAALR